MTDKKIPCDICNCPTLFIVTRRCNNCWEVENRIDQYLKSSKGRRNIAVALFAAQEDALLNIKNDLIGID